jgi:tetratricopeptide (TPR) repeat protein
MRRLLALFLLFPLLEGLTSSAPAQEGRVTAEVLFEQAMPFFPPYTGDHRAFLTEEQRREVAAGSKLLAAVLELEPAHVRALWWLGHAHVLLAEDARSRRDDQVAEAHDELSIQSFTRALELDPTDPWAHYARGTARTHAGRHWRAAEDLQHAVETLDEKMRAPEFADNLPWLRFKALEWRPEVLMRMHAFVDARQELAVFHAAFSENSWPGLIARGESFLRERDFGAALDTYAETVEAYPNDPQAYALAGYVHGLLGEREAATRSLDESIRRELTPEMYSRLWLALLATDELRPAAEADVRDFLANAPQSLSPWDLTLGRFVMGEGDAEGFSAAANAERARRVENAEPLGGLMCEVAFYLGWHHESAGEGTAALASYRRAVGFQPHAFKWEWAFARRRYAELARREGLGLGPRALPAWTAEQSTWHVPGSRRTVSALGRDPQPGDLRLVVYLTPPGERLAALQVTFGDE